MSDDSLQWLQAVQGVFEGSQWGHAFRCANQSFWRCDFWCFFANLNDMILLLLLLGGTCFLEDDTFTGTRSWNKDNIWITSASLQSRVRLRLLRPILPEHSNISGPVSPTTICSFFFSQSITGASIIPNFLFFVGPPPPNPEKALKTTDSPIFPGELSQFDMDALKSVLRKQGHSLNPRWISLNRKIWLENLLALDGHTVLFTVWCVQSWDEKIFWERNCNYSHLPYRF